MPHQSHDPHHYPEKRVSKHAITPREGEPTAQDRLAGQVDRDLLSEERPPWTGGDHEEHAKPEDEPLQPGSAPVERRTGGKHEKKHTEQPWRHHPERHAIRNHVPKEGRGLLIENGQRVEETDEAAEHERHHPGVAVPQTLKQDRERDQQEDDGNRVGPDLYQRGEDVVLSPGLRDHPDAYVEPGCRRQQKGSQARKRR